MGRPFEAISSPRGQGDPSSSSSGGGSSEEEEEGWIDEGEVWQDPTDGVLSRRALNSRRPPPPPPPAALLPSFSPSLTPFVETHMQGV